MIASGLLNFRRCCALRLEGKTQVGILPICVSFEGRIMPCCIIVARLPTSACASRHAPCVPCWIALWIVCPAALCLLILINKNGMTAAITNSHQEQVSGQGTSNPYSAGVKHCMNSEMPQL